MTESPAPEAPTFDALPLSPEVRQAVDELGWVQPTPVQLAVFSPLADGADLVVQARTGTGKTAAFGLPLVDKRIRPEPRTQVLVLAPTRELALQSARELERLGSRRGIRAAAIYGGAPMEPQVRELAAGAHIVSGTPGRILDHLRRGSLVAEHIRTLVLDEADEMLSMGFAKELQAIVEELPKNRQTLLFSATIDDEVQRIAAKYLDDPIHISLSSDHVGAQTIRHFVYLVSGLGKSRDLIRILEADDPESAIIFCNTKAVTEQVANDLRAAGLDADWLNGDLPQSEREKVLAATRDGRLRYLVATDVAARGIDISHVTHVVNYDFPEALEQYVHRTGRTGRAGRTGTAISLVTPADLGQLYYLRLQYKIFPIERELPTEGELRARSELDRIEMIRAAVGERFAGPGNEGLRGVARRLLALDDAETIVAGLIGSFLGAYGTEAEVVEQAAAARRGRPARPASPSAGVSDETASRARSAPAVALQPHEGSDSCEQEPTRRRHRRDPGEERDAPQRRDEVEAPREAQPSPSLVPDSASMREEEDEPSHGTVFLNVGRRDGARVGDILRLFEQRAGIGKDALGRIRIRERHSFVAVPIEKVPEAVERLAGARFGDKELVAEIARADRSAPSAEPAG